MIKDRLRTLLNIRVKREAPPMGTKPRTGSKMTMGGLRMDVTSAPPDELWYFFSLQGWREINHPRDRRRYTDLPRASFDLLACCGTGERELRYRQLVTAAARNAATRRAGSVTGLGGDRPRSSLR